MKVGELIEQLKGYEDFDIEMTVSRRRTKKELEEFKYQYPYEIIDTELEIDDIAYSDKKVCLGCEII